MRSLQQSAAVALMFLMMTMATRAGQEAGGRAAGGGLGALAQSGIEGPIVVIDLVKFKPGGEPDYDKYAAGAKAKVEDLGGEVIFRGNARAVDGVKHEEWDRLTMRKYPTPQAVLEMGGSKEYQSVFPLRLTSVERSFVYAFAAHNPGTDPHVKLSESKDAVYMLNLLRFKPDGGREAYFGQYGPATMPLILKTGGGPVLRLKGVTPVIADETIEELILVMYPAPEKFSAMFTGEDYGKIAHLRTDAIELGLLWPFSP